MKEIKLFFELVPGRFDELGLIIHELKIIGEGTIELDLKGYCLAFNYFLYNVLVGI
jgi:hypothetical protein